MGSDCRPGPPRCRRCISIHAPRMGSDGSSPACPHPQGNFNPRSPDGERQHRSKPRFGQTRFQSTLPGWGATRHRTRNTKAWYLFQSTLPGWGATLQTMNNKESNAISIHAPRMGSDQSADTRQHHVSISIHAPRMGSDLGERGTPVWQQSISIHAPRMGSDVCVAPSSLRGGFQSTLPGWGATAYEAGPRPAP